MENLYIIENQKLDCLDEFFDFNNTINLEKEINEIIDCFWNNTGEYEKNYKPLLISHLNIEWLRRIFIYYISLKNLSKKYDKIIVKDTNYFIELFANEFGLILEKKRRDNSNKLNMDSNMYWLDKTKSSALKKIYFKYKCYIELKKKIEIIYLDAGKLNSEFSSIKNSFNAKFIQFKKNEINKINAHEIEKKIISNINNINLSIPNKFIIKLIKDKILNFLPDLLNYIDCLINIIQEKKIKIAIISTPSHDMHLSLFVASQITKIPCVMISHGLIKQKNINLDNFKFYNCRISNYEPRYNNSFDFSFKPDWLYEKKI